MNYLPLQTNLSANCHPLKWKWTLANLYLWDLHKLTKTSRSRSSWAKAAMGQRRFRKKCRVKILIVRKWFPQSIHGTKHSSVLIPTTSLNKSWPHTKRRVSKKTKVNSKLKWCQSWTLTPSSTTRLRPRCVTVETRCMLREGGTHTCSRMLTSAVQSLSLWWRHTV